MIHVSNVKKMAELLRGGAKMLSSTCPECGSILFKVNDDVICSNCNKRVVIIKDARETETLTKILLLDQVENTTITKISEIEQSLREEKSLEGLQRITDILSTLLEILERIRAIKRN
jgi:UPF0148 protein